MRQTIVYLRGWRLRPVARCGYGARATGVAGLRALRVGIPPCAARSRRGLHRRTGAAPTGRGRRSR